MQNNPLLCFFFLLLCDWSRFSLQTTLDGFKQKKDSLDEMTGISLQTKKLDSAVHCQEQCTLNAEGDSVTIMWVSDLI